MRRKPMAPFRVYVGKGLDEETAYMRFLKRKPRGRDFRGFRYWKKTGWVSAV